MSAIAENLRRIRIQRGLTVSQITDRLHALGYLASEQTVSRWQRCITKVPAECLEHLAEALNCPISSIIYTQESAPQIQTYVLDTSGMSEHQKQTIRWLQNQWNGDMSTLLEFDLLYAKLPQNIRQQIAFQGIRLYQEAIKSNSINFSGPRVDIGKIIKGWHKISKT